MQDNLNRLKQLRTTRGLSLATLGVEVGVHESTVSRWESGRYAIPDSMKVRLADFFGVSVPYLMGWTNGGNGDNGEREVA